MRNQQQQGLPISSSIGCKMSVSASKCTTRWYSVRVYAWSLMNSFAPQHLQAQERDVKTERKQDKQRRGHDKWRESETTVKLLLATDEGRKAGDVVEH